MELIQLDIDLSKVQQYKTFETDGESFLDKSVFIYVPFEYHDTLIKSLEELLSTYKVDNEHLHYFLYIVGQHLALFQTMEEMRINASECVEPLRFLKEYLNQKQEIEKLYRSEEKAKKALSNRYIEIVSPDLKSKKSIKLSNTDFVIKGVFQLFKNKYDLSLREQLEPYNDIPPIETINNLLAENEYILNYASQYFIAQIALSLNDYIDNNIAKELSRKKYLFIFDIIFLNGLFDLETDGDPIYQVTTDFEHPSIGNTEKTLHIKTIIHRYNKYMKNRKL